MSLDENNNIEFIKLMKASDISLNIDEHAKLFINQNKVVAQSTVEGLEVKVKEFLTGIDIHIHLKQGVVVEKPVYFCFGVLEDLNIQEIRLKAIIEKDAKIDVIGYCTFPQNKKIQHIMKGEIELKENAHFSYKEKHIHNEKGLVEVYPHATVHVGKNAKYIAEFDLLKGKVGILDIKYLAKVHESGTAEMIAKVNAFGEDKIRIEENAELLGPYARSVLKSKIAVRENAEAEVYNSIKAIAAHTRGHVDCTEITQGNGKAKAYPSIEVSHPEAHVTHEARIGGVEDKQLITLMAKGLEKEEAENIIIQGLLS